MSAINKIHTAWNVCIELVEDRGYTLNPNYKKLTPIDVKYLLINNKLNIIAKNEVDKKIIYVIFIHGDKIKLSIIKEIYNKIYSKSPIELETNILFIPIAKPSTTILKLEKNIEYPNIQITWYLHFQLNPTKHVLVPKHEKLNDEESAFILNKFKVKHKNQFPVLLKTDIISRYYNFKRGDIIKISDNTLPLNTVYITYRIVN
tara:strand:- start:1318 stop:1926 length:609 start_codon:yes stop_codon:yes gene_type:complete